MRALIQRVSHANVVIEGKAQSSIQTGLLVLLGITHTDSRETADKLVKKVLNLRVFNDIQGRMNHSLKETGGELMLISQFTLYGNAKKGNRPSYIEAAPPEVSEPLYLYCIEQFERELGKKIATGIFGADMNVSLCNQGPVTIWFDTDQ